MDSFGWEFHEKARRGLDHLAGRNLRDKFWTLKTEIKALDRRVTSLEKSNDGLRTAFIKLVPIVEETRLRVSKIEDDVSEIKHDLRALRKDLPGMIADAMRDVLRENK